jgi:Xaa-Pro aminopeptidase
VQRWGFDGVLKVGMTICVEALIGAAGGKECVKLEQQILVTERDYELLSARRWG